MHAWIKLIAGGGLFGVVLMSGAIEGYAQEAVDRDAIERAVVRLGDDDYLVREAATRELFRMGPGVVAFLREEHGRTGDAEVRRRLSYVLDNITPPCKAVLVVRAVAGGELEPGMIVTHVNSRPVSDRDSLREEIIRGSRRVILRVRAPDGPREIGPVGFNRFTEVLDYVSPRGEILAETLRLYATGYVERAYDLFATLPGPIPENEWSTPLRARIAYTAGHGEEALAMMGDRLDEIRATGSSWSSPSSFDMRGPGPAPFHMEWALASLAGASFYESRNDPDLRIQRTLAPAGRSVDALVMTAGYWRNRYQSALSEADSVSHVAGNQLAVTAWMFHELGLYSECCRLIEPRSAMLRAVVSGYRKWIRVDTDAWTPFLAGDTRKALDDFYEDAIDVLQRPPTASDNTALTRNPHVAARVAFFLYRIPNDERVARTLGVLRHYAHPALGDYLWWMLYGLDSENQAIVRADLLSTLPLLADANAHLIARAAGLLEYVQEKPDAEILFEARRLISAGQGGADREVWTAIIDAMGELCANRPGKALDLLSRYADHPDVIALRHTAEFMNDPPEAALKHALLRKPILAVPSGAGGHDWIILARDGRLLRFNSAADALSAIERPTKTWFAGPLTWPWFGREEASGRVWAYGRRRVIEIGEGEAGEGIRLNINTDDISAFHAYLGPHFSRLEGLLPSAIELAGENGEFLRSEILDNGEFVADPDLPEIAVIEPLARAPGLIHAAVRGGGHLLIDVERERVWTSTWMAEQLGLSKSPMFFALAPVAPNEGEAPIVMLISDQGLIRFDAGAETLERIALPGDDPYPPIIPESTPYERRDARFFYCAHLPEAGGGVYRLTLADGGVEEMDMVNEALPEHYYDMMSRGRLRESLNRRLAEAGLPDAETFIRESAEAVKQWSQRQETAP